MKNRELRHLTARLSADVREGRFEADWDLGKSEYLGDAQDKEAAYLAFARPVLEVYLARGLVTDEEFAQLMKLADNRDRHADQLQALAETLAPD